MEEDIKILEKALKVLKGEVSNLTMGFEETAQALENLLTRYKDIKRINSDLQGEQEQLYNKIDKLEEKNEEWQRAYQEEKDKQFELLREKEEYRIGWCNTGEEVEKLKKDINKYKKATDEALKILEDNEKKDKVINEMAKEILNIDEIGFAKCNKCEYDVGFKFENEECIKCIIKDFTSEVEREGK